MTHSDILLKPSENKGFASLGFGCMRLPDVKEVAQMTDLYLEAGFNYFDTAYEYGGSEEKLKKALVARHPRDSYMVADKIPPWETRDRKSCDKIFKTMLSRLGLDYLDFLLVHSLDEDNERSALKADIYGFAAEQKKKGSVRHVGFSFHGSTELLEKIFKAHPEMEFVQLQLNYIDVLRGSAKQWQDMAIKYDKPIIVMEPMRGGALANLPSAAEALMKTHAPDVSVASWANRYAATLSGAVCLLSGMSSLAQMRDNIRTFSPLKPLSKEEMEIIEAVLTQLGKVSSIPCTGCKYCLACCPPQIEIAQCFSLYNEFKRGGAHWNLSMIYDTIPQGRRPEDCTACGACVERCPQKIDIPGELKRVSKTLC